MSTTYTSNTKLGKPAVTDTGWDVPINANADALEALAPLAALNVSLAEVPSASLNVRVAAGTYVKAAGTIGTYAGTSSQAITTLTTKYLYLTDSGTLTVGTAWPTGGTNHVRLAVVVAGATTITSVTDARMCFASCNTP